jgi:hypothetical protein
VGQKQTDGTGAAEEEDECRQKCAVHSIVPPSCEASGTPRTFSENRRIQSSAISSVLSRLRKRRTLNQEFEAFVSEHLGYATRGESLHGLEAGGRRRFYEHDEVAGIGEVLTLESVERGCRTQGQDSTENDLLINARLVSLTC